MSGSPFLLVKKKGKDINAEPKRIRFGRSIKEIINDATKALGKDRPIKTLYSIQDKVITNIKELKNGDTLICSYLTPEEVATGDIFSFPSQKTKNTQNNKNPATQKKSIVPPPDNNVPKIKDTKQPKDVEDEKPKKEEIKKNKKIKDEDEEEDEEENKNEEENENEEESENESESEKQKNKKNEKKEKSGESEQTEKEKEENKEDNASTTSQQKNSDKSSVFSENHDFRMSQLIEEKGEEVEHAEKINIYKLLMEKVVGEIPDEYPEELNAKVEEVLKSHALSCPGQTGGATIKGKIGIIGPHHSGKSTFMNILTKKYLQVLISQGKQRETMVYCFDFRKMKKHVMSPLSFYKKFLHSVISQLIIQYPLLRLRPERVNVKDESRKIIKLEDMSQKTPVADELMRVFLQYADDEPTMPLSPKFPKTAPFTSIASDIEKLRLRIENSLAAKDQMDTFYTNLFLLPKELATTFGFDNVHYVIDHLEYLDVVVNPIKPFSKRAEAINLSEFAKLMMSNGTFFVASEDESKITGILDKANEYSIDLYRGTEFINIFGICKPNSNLAELKVELDNGTQIYLNQNDCGGCNSFLTRWKMIGEAAENLGKEKAESSKKKMKILLNVRELLDDLIYEFDEVAVDFTPVYKK